MWAKNSIGLINCPYMMKSSYNSKSYLSLYVILEPCHKNYVRKEWQNAAFAVAGKNMKYHIERDGAMITKCLQILLKKANLAWKDSMENHCYQRQQCNYISKSRTNNTYIHIYTYYIYIYIINVHCPSLWWWALMRTDRLSRRNTLGPPFTNMV